MADTNYDKLCGIAINRFHMSAITFYELTPIEFSTALLDWGEQSVRESRNRNDLRETIYDAARFIIFWLVNISGKSLKRNLKTYSDVVEFDWEKKEKIPQTVDQMKQTCFNIIAAFKKPNKKKN